MRARKYRKEPVVIEAVLWGGQPPRVLEQALGAPFGTFALSAWFREDSPPPKLRIQTLEGTMSASVGHYIIKGVQGEFYPCKPDIFEQTYEVVGD